MDIRKNNNLIYELADLIRGPFLANKYKEVIIVFYVIKLFEHNQQTPKDKEILTFSTLKRVQQARGNKDTENRFFKVYEDDPLVQELKALVESKDKTLKDILVYLDYENIVRKLYENNCLETVINFFADYKLDETCVDLSHKSGYFFEELIRKFSENPEAGDHYTAKEVVELLSRILLLNLNIDKKQVNILDMACGTGGMLTTIKKCILNQDNHIDVNLYGQEINPESCGICKANIFLHDSDPSNICLANTMKEDAFKDIKMDYVICNPPFGQPWGGKKTYSGVNEAILKERFKGIKGRFFAGLPSTSDMQLLFLQHGIYKLKDDGKAAIICNASILYSGASKSGESDIRKYLLEEDLIESIVALPSELFYNTSIQIYAVFINKKKDPKHKNKILLINAENQYKHLEKSLGYKKKYIAEEQIKEIISLYKNWGNTDISKIVDRNEFLYKEYSILLPLQRSAVLSEENIAKVFNYDFMCEQFGEYLFDCFEDLRAYSLGIYPEDAKAFTDKYPSNPKRELVKKLYLKLREASKEEKFNNFKEFSKYIFNALSELEEISACFKKQIALRLSKHDFRADIIFDAKGKCVLDSDSKDIEKIPYEMCVDEHFRSNVLVHLPTAIKGDECLVGSKINFSKYFYQEHHIDDYEEVLRDFEKNNRLVKELEDSLFGFLFTNKTPNKNSSPEQEEHSNEQQDEDGEFNDQF